MVRALVVVERDEAIHERARGDERDVAERAGAHLLLRGEPAAAKALRVANDRVDFCFLDFSEHAPGRGQLRGERLLDEKRELALYGRQYRLHVQVLVGRDDRGRHFRTREELAEVGGDELRLAFVGDELRALALKIRDADP